MFPCPAVQEITDNTKRHIRTHSSTMSINFSMLVLLPGKKGIHIYIQQETTFQCSRHCAQEPLWVYVTILQYIPPTCLFNNQTLFITYSTLEKQLNKYMCISRYHMVTLQYKPFITKSIYCTYTFLNYNFQYIVVYTVWTMPALVYKDVM